MSAQIESSQSLQENLAEILVKWPLYRLFVYVGKACHSTSMASGYRSGLLPEQIRMFCGHKACGYDTLWEISGPTVYFGEPFIKQASYTCRNCGKATTYYCYIWQEREDDNVFVKIGQYPELEERVPDDLRLALDGEDLKLYKNALRMRNFNLGVAAVAYMRRIIENRMNDMLEILHEAAVTHNAPSELVARHQEIKMTSTLV